MLDGRRQGAPCAAAAPMAWAAFEMPKGMPTRYRAGIEFGGTPTRRASTSFAKKTSNEELRDRVDSYCLVFAWATSCATTLSSRMIVSLRSEPVEINPTGTPLTSSSRADVALRFGRQLVEVARALGRRRPARPRFVDRRVGPQRVEVRRKLGDRAAADPVAGADLDRRRGRRARRAWSARASRPLTRAA